MPSLTSEALEAGCPIWSRARSARGWTLGLSWGGRGPAAVRRRGRDTKLRPGSGGSALAGFGRDILLLTWANRFHRGHGARPTERTERTGCLAPGPRFETRCARGRQFPSGQGDRCGRACQSAVGNRRSVPGARRFRGGRDGTGAWPDPGGILPGSFREAGRNLRGRFEDDSRWVRGAPGGGCGVRPRQRPRRWRGGGRGASAVGGEPRRILAGSWPEPSGDGSGTIRGGFEGLRAADAASDRLSGPGDAAAPFRECVDFEASAAGAGATGGVPGGFLPGSWRDPSGILPGSWPEPSGTVRGRRGGGRAVRTTPAISAMARSRTIGDSAQRAPGQRPGPRRPAGAWNQALERIHG